MQNIINNKQHTPTYNNSENIKKTRNKIDNNMDRKINVALTVGCMGCILGSVVMRALDLDKSIIYKEDAEKCFKNSNIDFGAMVGGTIFLTITIIVYEVKAYIGKPSQSTIDTDNIKTLDITNTKHLV